MTGPGADPAPEGDPAAPPGVAERLLHAFEEGRSSIAALVDAELRVRWMSASASRVIGMEASEWVGRYALEGVHPEDVERILESLAQRPAAGSAGRLTLPPVRYRIQHPERGWVPVEALVEDLLDDPVIQGFLVIVRAVGGEIDGIGRITELLTAGAPVVDVLGACAGLVPDYIGQAAVVGILHPYDPYDPGPPGVPGGPGEGPDGRLAAEVVGAEPDSAAARLAADDRWWRPTIADGRARTATAFVDFPDDLAETARAEGFQAAWTLPLTDTLTGEVIGCVVVWVHVTASMNIATDGGLRQAAGLAGLVVAEQRRHQALRRAALTDPLTGLGNRSALRWRLERARGPVTVALVDLDHFKPINDAHGHDAGDRVLQAVADRLLAAVRGDDCVIRFGGDEFAVVFAEAVPAPPDGQPGAVDRLRAAVERPVAIGPGETVAVGASIGLATAPAHHVVQLADRALYEVKRARPPASTPSS